MAGKTVLSPQTNQLLEKIVDGASLIYNSDEAHNCDQLKSWLKCHGRPQKKGEKSKLIVAGSHSIDFTLKKKIIFSFCSKKRGA